jgi:uncharacterized protein (TIGR02996 family)
MTSELAFLRAMQEEDDDTSRLVFADWLDDNDQPERAEFIRIQCELARWVPDLGRRTQLQRREQELLARHGEEWIGPLSEYCLSWRFERGLAHIVVNAQQITRWPSPEAARALFRQAGVGRLRLEQVQRSYLLADLLFLDVVTNLDVTGSDLLSHHVSELLAAPNLENLRHLDLSNNRLESEHLWGLMLSPRLTHLRRLVLRNNRIQLDGHYGQEFSNYDPTHSLLDLHGNPLRPTAQARVAEQQNGLVWREPGCPPRLFTSIGMQLALIPAGTYLMGAPPDEQGHFPNETPQHEVTITQAFYLGLYPVTQRDYQTVMGSNPSLFQSQNADRLNHPVENVSWEDAVEFCHRLSRLPDEWAAGRVYRLPTEAEWEHACRAGGTSPFTWGDTACSTQANFAGRSPYGNAAEGPYLERTSSVGSYPPNAFGLFDMHGNVWEWCNDWYQSDYYRHSPHEDPPGPDSGETHTLRGGSWFIVGRGCRCAERCYTDEAPTRRPGSVGFRVAMDLRS